MGQEEIWDITVEETECYFAGGVLSHNSGKTLAALMEIAWAATGTHPVDGKYPRENGNLVIVGANWKHIGLSIVPTLFQRGAFKMIKDEITGEFRAFNPVTDFHRSKEALHSTALIPPRMIKSKSWQLKSANYMNTCELTNGWTIHFFSSDGEPPQGFQADLILIDEDLENENWVPEMQARLSDRKGRLIWAATPHSKNDALSGLDERAEALEAAGNTKDLARFQLSFLDNPHIDDDEKRKRVEEWSALGEEVVRMRVDGYFERDSVKMFPNFSMAVHGYDQKNLKNGVVPDNWCRYAVIDPGHKYTAVIFAAVPPDDSMVLLYDELYIGQCNAIIFAEELKKKVRHHRFYAFIIDSRGARITDIGSGRTAQDQYSAQMALLEIESEVTGHSFIPGCDDPKAGYEAVRTSLHIQPGGNTRIRVLRDALPNFEREIKRYKKIVVRENGLAIVKDEPSKKGDYHLMDCLRYLCAYNPKYHAPVIKVQEPWWVKDIERRNARKDPPRVDFAPDSYTDTWYAGAG